MQSTRTRPRPRSRGSTSGFDLRSLRSSYGVVENQAPQMIGKFIYLGKSTPGSWKCWLKRGLAVNEVALSLPFGVAVLPLFAP